MGNNHRLQPAVQLAQRREDSAAHALADFQRRLDEQQARLQQLLEFRREYSEQLNTSSRSGISSLRFHDYMVFLAKLDRSIAKSRQNLETLQREFQHKRHLWLMSHAKIQALEGVVKRDHREQERAQNRREQTDSDERNLRNYRGTSEE